MGLRDLLARKEQRQYRMLLDLINKHEYRVLFVMDRDKRFGLSNDKHVDTIIAKLEREALKNPYLLLEMHNYGYHRIDYFTTNVLKKNPNIIEILINNKERNIEKLIVAAIDNGYNPSSDYINENITSFANIEVMKKIVDMGYRPSDELIESATLRTVFADELLLLKAIGWGFVPSINFIKRSNLLKRDNLVDIIIDTMELTSEIINSDLFYGCPLAQQRIIKKHPELLSSIRSDIESYEQLMIEAFKLGYVPDNLDSDISITSNFLLFSKLVKQHPELVKYCHMYNVEERKKIDELALCMGYVPTINDVKTTEYVKKSLKLMQVLIARRPEAIKYIEEHPLSGSYSIDITQDEFYNLARQALNNGYIPVAKDLELNPRLRDSFDIMKYLIQDNPELINMIRMDTPNKEELLRVAVANGFDGELVDFYVGEHKAFSSMCNELLITETGIKYQIEHNQELDKELPYLSYYSIDLYNYLTLKGYEIERIVPLFTSSFDVMKDIIKKHPEMVTLASKSFSREEVDELAFLAIKTGYVPKEEDEIFGCGLEVTKMMVRKYPSYLEKVKLLDRVGIGLGAVISPIYHVVCKIACDNGFIPDIETIGNGWGGVTNTAYNSSYDIMKKVIPLKPELIESCTVDNKQEYDELCRLALDNGYEVKDDYALTHWGIKMCSNVDLMSIYIKDHPNFLLNVTITESSELIQIIDIAIKAGFELKRLTPEELLKLFINVDEDKWSIYLDKDTIENIRKAQKLRINNDEIEKTVNPKFLSSEIVSTFSEEQIEIISCYPKLQEDLLRLSEHDIRTEIVHEIINKYQDHLEWIKVLEKVLANSFSSEFSNLISDLKGRTLSEDIKRKLMYLLMTDNHLDISSYRELENYDSIRELYIDMLIKRDTVDSLKTAYLERVYSIDLASAMNYVKLYGGSLESKSIDSLDDISKRVFVILANMKKIINLNSKEILYYYINNVKPDFKVEPDMMVTYESRLKHLFTKAFNESFNKPLLEDRIESRIDGEEDLDIYLAAGRKGNKKCRMMITSIGAYTNMEEPDDYYSSWNVDKIASHGCCCSYVGEKNLGTAEIKYCCLGFTDYELGSLQLSGPYDLCSISTDKSYQIASMYSPMYLLPDDILDYTRHTHNETVWERRNIGKNSKFKKQPSYIVYFVDNFEDRLTNEDAKRQWESVKKASANFAREVDGRIEKLPIMVVEREKIAASQLENINDNLKKFASTLDSNLIGEIVSDYESNYAGNRNYHLNIMEKYFPRHDCYEDSVVGKIIEVIRGIEDDSVALSCLKALEKAVKSEQEKYNNTQHGVGQSVPSFNIEMSLIEINRLKVSLNKDKTSILDMIGKIDGNDHQFIKSDIESMNKDLLANQLSVDDILNMLNDHNISNSIKKYEQEIIDENINARLKIHGDRHIRNVLLYSALIGKNVIKDERDFKILLVASKYHDIGRKTDANENHAKSSAEYVIRNFKDMYSSEDLGMIATIIEFHEVSRDLKNIDEIFMSIANKYNVSNNNIARVRKMAEVLKDADALDRTRFINPARLDYNYLHFDISKKMVRFAAMLQETYALEDLVLYDANKEINILLQTYTPQEVIRTIRHQTRGVSSEEEIRYFIKAWSDTINLDNESLDEGSVKHGK